MARKKKNLEINEVISEGEIKEREKYECITSELNEIQNTSLSNNTLLVKLNNLYVDEANKLLYIHRNLNSINLNKEIPNSAETLINKLVEIASKLYEGNSENFNGKFIYKNVTDELISFNDKARKELDDVDKFILGLAEKSLWSIIHDLTEMNKRIQEYMETNKSIENFSLEEFLTDSLTNQNYTEEEHKIFETVLQNIKVEENRPKLVRKIDNE